MTGFTPGAVECLDHKLEPFEEQALVELDKIVCGHFRDHAPTNLRETPGLGPIWTQDCRHCGERMTWAEFFRWQDANRAEWAGGEA